MEVKRNFVRFISHEMRTPLNAASMGLRVIKQSLTGRTPRADMLVTLHDVNEACDLSIGILNDILDYDKITVGAMTLDRVDVNAWELLSGTVQLFKMQVRWLQ